MMKIVVIGAGINGLATAIKIKEFYKHIEVVLLSSDFSPNTTGDGSGGLWYPYLCGSTSEHLLNKWGSVTYRLLHELWLQGGYNICAIPIYYFFPETTSIYKPEWANSVFGYQIFDKRQLDYYSQLHKRKYGGGLMLTTFVVNPTSFLKYLKERFEQANGRVLKGRVTSLHDPLLMDYDVIVNCTGLAARGIVPDTTVYPIRGQVSRLVAPWINYVIIEEDKNNYVIPNYENCVLGGTHQEHDYNTNVDEHDKKIIIDGCEEIFPGLKNANVVNDWVGSRPGRHAIRLDSEENLGKLFIHNYGHGGSGLTLFWGCAESVLDILKEAITKREGFDLALSGIRILVNQKIFNDLISSTMFIYLIVISVNLGVCIIQIAQTKGDLMSLISSCLYVLDCLIQLLLFYWHSNEVTEQSVLVSYGNFESDWPEIDKQYQKEVALLAVTTTKRLVFRAGPFNEMTLKTFIAILRASYTFYTLLNETN